MNTTTSTRSRSNSGYLSDDSTTCSVSSRRGSFESFRRVLGSLHRRKHCDSEPIKLPDYHNKRRGAVCQAISGDALHNAAQHNNEDALALLIWSGADTERLDANGKSALQVAKESNRQGSHHSVIEMLKA